MAWRLDQEIRHLTNNAYGMDELQLRLYQQYNNNNQGYRKHDVLNLLNNITDSDMSEFWNQYIENTAPIDFDALLDYYGLQKTLKNTNNESEVEPLNAWIGAALNITAETVTIKTVDSDSPAWKAGLNAGDQLLAIDGIKVTTKNVEQRIQQLHTNQTYTLHYFSAGRLSETQLTAVPDPNPEFTIEAIKTPSKEQMERYKAWTELDLVQ